MKEYAIGLDLGNSTTKLYTETVGKPTKLQFPSLVKMDGDSLNAEKKIKVIYDSCQYSVGVGSANTTLAKYYNEPYKVMLLTAIGSAFPNETEIYANLTVGLPISLFKKRESDGRLLREKLHDHIKSYGRQNIHIDGQLKSIVINKVGVWCESNIIISDMNRYANEKIIVIDIGGITVDSMEFYNNIVGKNKTSENGMIKLSQKIYQEFKNQTSAELDKKAQIELFEKARINGTFYADGVTHKLNRYYKMVQDHVTEIFSDLSDFYTFSDKRIVVIGGGAEDLRPFLTDMLNVYSMTIVDEPVFANAKAFYDYTTNVLMTSSN